MILEFVQLLMSLLSKITPQSPLMYRYWMSVGFYCL